MALRTGGEYLESLNDRRRVLHDGKAIPSVVEAPGFRRVAQTIARFYDFQSRAELADLMSFQADDGERAAMAFLPPKSRDDLRRRASAYAAWAEVSCGFSGRSPDYMNTMLTQLAGVAASAHAPAPWADRIRDMYLRSRREDLFWTHTFVYPFKRHPPNQAEPSAVRIVKKSADGIWVKGARGLATLGPFADMNLNHEPLRRNSEPVAGVPLAVTFALPVAAPGVTWVCRDVDGNERSSFDAPLSGLTDEIDAIALFDDVFIPNEQILACAENFEALAVVLQLFSGWQEQLTFHQSLVRYIAKTKFLLGVAHLIAESSGTSSYVNIQQRLGDFVLCIDLLEALAIAAIEEAREDPSTGWWMPSSRFASAGLRMYGEYYPRLLDHLLMLGASRYISTPQEATLDALGESLERYLGPSSEAARDQISLYRLAWDVAGTAYGRRHDLYERFFAGGYEMRRAASYVAFDKSEVVAMVRRLLHNRPASGAPLPPRS